MECVPLAMVADRVVLLPGTTIGRRTIMGSGALAKRNTMYEDGSTWIGNGTVPLCISEILLLKVLVLNR